MDLKTIEKHFQKLGCLTEIDGETLWICKDSGLGNHGIICELEEMLPKPEFKFERYDCCGETQFAVTQRRFLKGWW